jgi:galactokinase
VIATSASSQIAITLDRAFRERYGAAPIICRAPGRVNLIGEHTDYNDGFVMPAAIEFYTYVAASPRDDRRVVVASENFAESVEFDLNSLRRGSTGHWSDYVRGVAAVLDAEAGVCGANLLVHGEVPLGAGLSSSAAIEVATAFALLSVARRELDRVHIARVCQKAEHEYAGTKCGIMDQYIACFGEEGRALLLDCRSLQHELLPLPEGVRVVICNSMVKHALVAGEYNARRADCAAGVEYFARKIPGVRSLRDVSPEQLERFGKGLSPVIFRRCRHVVSEIARTVEAAAALRAQDLKLFGRLMGESHRSLRDDYEVSCREIDLLVELANDIPGVYGSRMTGGGFGGCTVSFVRNDAVADFEESIKKGYTAKTSLVPEIFVTAAAEGAGMVLTGSST